MGDQGHNVPMGDAVAAQLVGHETRPFLALPLQEFLKESPRRTPVPTRLDEDAKSRRGTRRSDNVSWHKLFLGPPPLPASKPS